MFLQDDLKTSWKRLKDILARRLEDVLKTSWKGLEDVLKTYDQDEYIGLDQDVLKTSPEDIGLRRIYPPWSRRWRSREDEGKRRLQDVFIKINVFWVCLFFLLLLLLFCLVYSLKLSISTFWFICSSNRSFSVITPLQISLRKELIVLNFWKLYVFAFLLLSLSIFCSIFLFFSNSSLSLCS